MPRAISKATMRKNIEENALYTALDTSRQLDRKDDLTVEQLIEISERCEKSWINYALSLPKRQFDREMCIARYKMARFAQLRELNRWLAEEELERRRKVA